MENLTKEEIYFIKSVLLESRTLHIENLSLDHIKDGSPVQVISSSAVRMCNRILKKLNYIPEEH